MGTSREVEILITFFLFIVMRYRSIASMEAFISLIFLFGKGLVLIISYIISWNWFWSFSALFAALALSLPPPSFEWSTSVVVVSDATLDSVVLNGAAKNAWVVFFYAPWDVSSNDFIPSFSSLAENYSGLQVRFARIDLSHYPSIAERFKINVDSGSYQLPTLVMFQCGKESERVPPFDAQENIIAQTVSSTFTISHFKLDQLAETNKDK